MEYRMNTRTYKTSTEIIEKVLSSEARTEILITDEYNRPEHEQKAAIEYVSQLVGERLSKEHPEVKFRIIKKKNNDIYVVKTAHKTK